MSGNITKNKLLKDKSGVTLLLALIIMSGVVAVSIGISVIIVNQLQFSSNIDRATTAFYTAESGIESGLKLVKDNRAAGVLSTVITSIKGTNGTMPNITPTARWDLVNSKTSEDYILTSLALNRKVSLDLPTGVDKIEIRWSDACNGDSTLELNALAISGTGKVEEDPYRQLMHCDSATPCSKVTVNMIDPLHSYILNFTPLRCDIRYLTVTSFDNGGNKLNNISNRVYLRSDATHATSSVSVSATVPWRLPPQAIFDFVIFSEGTLTKE